MALAVLRRRDFPFDFKRRSFRIQGDKAARILRLGLPVAVQNVLVTLSFLIITAIVNHMDVLAQSAAVGLVGIFTPRGGISIYPYCNYGRPGTKYEELAEYRMRNHDL